MKDKIDFSNKTLILLIGISHSGKTFYAKKLIKDKGYLVVSTDAIRGITTDGRYYKELDWLTFNIVKIMVQSLFIIGHKIVVFDACNLNPRARWHFENEQWNVKYIFIDTSVETCIKRARKRGFEHMEIIINNMSNSLDVPYDAKVIEEKI